MCDVILINEKVIYNKNKATLINIETKISTTLVTPANNCLALILKNGNEITEQKELFYKVWEEHGLPINQNTFYQNISLIRRSFRTLGIEEIIVTIPRRGLTVSSSIKHEPYLENPIPDVSTVQKHPDQNITVKEEPFINLKSNLVKKHTSTKEIITHSITLLKLLIPISCFFVFNYIINDYFTPASSMKNYTLNGKVNGCNVFYDKYKENMPWPSISRSIEKLGRSCNRGEKIYFTSAKDIPRVSLIYCAGSILDEKTQCTSQYIFMNGGL